MAAGEVKYFYGTAEEFNRLPSKDQFAFYKVGNDLYIGSFKVSNAADLAKVRDKLGEDTLNTSAQTTVAAINEILSRVGKGNLETDNKTNIIAAVNELASKIKGLSPGGGGSPTWDRF